MYQPSAATRRYSANQFPQPSQEWDSEQGAESREWTEARIFDSLRKIRDSGVSLDGVKHADKVRAFLGPWDPEELSNLLVGSDDPNLLTGSGRYGDAWRMPLGYKARASVGVRMALVSDRRCGVSLDADGLPDIDWCPVEGGDVTIEIRADTNNPTG